MRTTATLLSAVAVGVALMSSVAAQQNAGVKALYGSLCATCHGDAGKGDTPVAAALDPKPADFTESAFQKGRTDEELAKVITEGRNLMPGFGSQLSRVQINALVGYVRSLGQAPEP